MARSAGTDLLFAPEGPAMYPAGYATYVNVEGLTDTLCGRSRPGHFRGVTTVVARLFSIVQPHEAFFGRKDFQQLAVIQRMTADLNLPVEIVGMPIVREADGLAMSSRNVYLTAGERQQALVLSRAIATAQKMARGGVRDCCEILAALQSMIEEQNDARSDYLQICHQLTLQEQDRVDSDSVLLMAVFVGKTRLIDNGFLLQ
jgi:pantoate--beta-alanine ligase